MTDTVIDHGHADAFVSAEEAARIVGVTARTVRRWVEAGDVQAETGKRGRLVSVSDVRRRAVSGHDRTRPPVDRVLSSTPSRTDTDVDTSAVSAVLSPVLIAHAEQIERLTREAMTEKARADQAESRVTELEAELEQVSAELLAAQIGGKLPGHVTAGDSAEPTMPENRENPAQSATISGTPVPDTSRSSQGSESRPWWRRLLGLD